MRSTLGLLVLVSVLGVAARAEAGFTFVPEHPVVGEPVTLTITGDDNAPLADAAVTATYYPNAAVERVVELGTTDAEGRLEWSPHHAGLVTLAAGDVSKTIGVRFTGLPIKGLIVFLIAGTLLFGGIVFGSRRILQGEYVDPTT